MSIENIEELNSLGIKEIQELAKSLRIHPSYKVGGVRIRKNKAELLRDIRKHKMDGRGGVNS